MVEPLEEAVLDSWCMRRPEGGASSEREGQRRFETSGSPVVSDLARGSGAGAEWSPVAPSRRCGGVRAWVSAATERADPSVGEPGLRSAATAARAESGQPRPPGVCPVASRRQ